ncbi:alpha/beta fold hydrolase [Streptosporangium lutulentum]
MAAGARDGPALEPAGLVQAADPSRTARPPAITRLHEVELPTLVVTGLADVPEILALSNLLVEGIKGARGVEFPRTGHLPPLERPDEFNAALLDFLREPGTASH